MSCSIITSTKLKISFKHINVFYNKLLYKIYIHKCYTCLIPNQRNFLKNFQIFVIATSK